MFANSVELKVHFEITRMLAITNKKVRKKNGKVQQPKGPAYNNQNKDRLKGIK